MEEIGDGVVVLGVGEAAEGGGESEDGGRGGGGGRGEGVEPSREAAESFLFGTALFDAFAAGVGESVGGVAPEEVGVGEGVEGTSEVRAFGREEEAGGGGDAVFGVAGAALRGFEDRSDIQRLGGRLGHQG